MQQNKLTVYACDQFGNEDEGNVLSYTRVPGQETTVSVTLFFCSFSMGMREELFIPTVVAPFTATISSPHLLRSTTDNEHGQSAGGFGWRCDMRADYNVLQAPVEVRRRAWNNGFDEERLLATALLVAPHDAEAPALIVGLLQDDVPAPVEVTRREGGVGLHRNKQVLRPFQEVVPR